MWTPKTRIGGGEQSPKVFVEDIVLQHSKELTSFAQKVLELRFQRNFRFRGRSQVLSKCWVEYYGNPPEEISEVCGRGMLFFCVVGVEISKGK